MQGRSTSQAENISVSSLYVMGICGLKNEWEKNENNGVG